MSAPISLANFEAEAQAFLESNAKPRQPEATGWGEGSDKVGLLSEKTPDEELEELREAKEWRARVFGAGFGWITGPEQYGGRELPATHERAWQALEARYDTPSQSPFGIGLGMVAPPLPAHATDTGQGPYLH